MVVALFALYSLKCMYCLCYICWYDSAGTCVTGSNQVFVAGGSIRKLGRVNGRQVTIPECVSADVWTLNVNQRTWEQRTSMSRARCQFSMVVVDGWVIVVSSLWSSLTGRSCALSVNTCGQWTVFCVSFTTSLHLQGGVPSAEFIVATVLRGYLSRAKCSLPLRISSVFGFSFLYLLVNWAWWDWPLTLLTNHCYDTVSWVIWPVKVVPEMTYTGWAKIKYPSTKIAIFQKCLNIFTSHFAHLFATKLCTNVLLCAVFTWRMSNWRKQTSWTNFTTEQNFDFYY